MNFLVDNAISPIVSEELNKMGFDSKHVRDIGIQNATDWIIFNRAFEENRTIITADTDFGFLLSKWKKEKPSVIIFRKGSERHPIKQIELLKLNLTKSVKQAIIEGSIIIFEPKRIRIKRLPL